MDLYAYIIPLYPVFFAVFSTTIGIILDYDEFKAILQNPTRIFVSLFCNQVVLPLVSHFSFQNILNDPFHKAFFLSIWSLAMDSAGHYFQTNLNYNMDFFSLESPQLRPYQSVGR